MKFTLTALSLTLLVFLLFSCKTKQYTLQEYTGPQITFGNGGGFTGLYTHYILLENGQLFKKKGKEEDYTAIEAVRKKEAKQIFKDYQELNLAKVELNEPGNMTYYVEYKNEEGRHTMTWGGTNEMPSDEVKSFYRALNNLISVNK